MIVKRPVLTRRPMLQTSQPTLPVPSRPVFLERKKAVYRPASSAYRRTEKPGSSNPQIGKLKKVDPKQWSKMEAKVASADSASFYATTMRPARNTGFDPDSIVIESGFKPIIRNLGPADVAQKRVSKTEQGDSVSQAFGEPQVQESSNQRPDNFEPVFIPSPPVPTVDTAKKPKKKNAKAWPGNDMEMAADRTNAYYLPPASNLALGAAPPASSEVLITFDGKKVKDSTLARSIFRIEEHPRSRLSSDVLSRTPQFGRFRGELPPLAPEEVSSDGSQLENRRLPSTDLSTPEIRAVNTKLTLVRSKRSPHEGHVYRTEARTNGSEAIHHDHHNHDHHNHQEHQDSLLGSAGQTIASNFGYILLTVVFYYVL